MPATSLLFWGVLFGAFGLAFFSYGKKQKAMVPLLAGLALLVVPYFISNVTVLVLIGLALIALPFVVRR